MEEDIHIVLPIFRRWNVEHVKRGANAVALGLTKVAVNVITHIIWMEEIISSSMEDIVLLEQIVLSVYSLML